MRKAFLFVLVFAMAVHVMAQKSVAGVRFSACLNREVPADFYKNKFLVLDFWATWCGPCIGSFPKLNALQKRYESNTHIVFASITGERRGKVDTFFKRKKDILPGVLHLIDDNDATGDYYDVHSLPTILVFTPTGKMVFKGDVDELSRSMDKVLKGENLLQNTQPKPVVKDDWKKYKSEADYIAIAGPSDTSWEENGSTFRSNDRGKIIFDYQRSALSDMISEIAGLTSVRLKCSDSSKGKQLINFYYKQTKNNFTEFDNGVLPEQYQNHMLHVLEKSFGFHTQWITERASAWKIIVKDEKLLKNNTTLSTHGSGGGLMDRQKQQYNFVNQQLGVVASYAEDILGLPVFATDTFAVGYDMSVEFSSFPAFSKAIAAYGLGLEKVEGYEIKKLYLVFE